MKSRIEIGDSLEKGLRVDGIMLEVILDIRDLLLKVVDSQGFSPSHSGVGYASGGRISSPDTKTHHAERKKEIDKDFPKSKGGEQNA